MALFKNCHDCFKNGFQTLRKDYIKKSPKFILGFIILPVRNISCLEVTKNMTVLSSDPKKTKVTSLTIQNQDNRPLVVMLNWLMAKKKHSYKYADIYIKRGFDVLNISINPWQFLWPVKGTQVVAADILKFLDRNKVYGPVLLHGFSVGGYLWGEVMVQMASETARYQHIIDRIEGQIWDSAVDVTEIHKGVPLAVFPKNKMMANALQQYIIYHMKAFDKLATRHYVRSSQMFHTSLVKAPALFLLSKRDTIGTETSNRRVKENWESMGVKVQWKIFEKSLHVGHFKHYPKEYTAEVLNFLDDLNLGKSSAQSVNQQSRKIQIKQ